MPNDEAVQLLYDNLASLPSEEYGTINLLPFAHDSDQVRSVKRQVCEAIVGLLDDAGHLKRHAVEPLVNRDAVVQCDKCSNTLVSLPTNENGVGRVNATMFISSIARVNTQCPHGVTTLDDMRVHMQREFDQEVDDDA